MGRAKERERGPALFVTADEVQDALPISRTRVYEIMHEAGAVHIGKSLLLPVDKWRKWLARASAGAFAPHVEASTPDVPPPSAATEEPVQAHEPEMHEPAVEPVERLRPEPRQPQPKERERSRNPVLEPSPELAKYLEKARRPSDPPPMLEPQAAPEPEVKTRQRKLREPRSPAGPRTAKPPARHAPQSAPDEERLRALHAELRALLED